MTPWLRAALDFMTTWGGAAALLAVGFWIAYQYVEPAPPSTLRLATGDPQGAYHQFGRRYRALLESEVTVELIPSSGSVANLGLLTRADDPVDVALVQGGVDTGEVGEQLTSLGSLFYEPVWVFHRLDPALRTLRDLAERRIGVGADGSGTQAVARTFLRANGIDDGSAVLVKSDAAAGAKALVDGDLDAVFVIASPAAEVIRALAAEDTVSLMSFDRADAYVRRYRYSARLDLPEGTLDLAANRPESDRTLLAVAANLVARRDLHPALADLLLGAATRVHAGAGIFQDAGEFPSSRHLVLPLDDDAARYYRYGPPFLQRYLPFWAANLVDRLKVMLLPLIALMLPLLKVMPPLYQWRIRSRVYRWYDDLQQLDPTRRPGDDRSTAERLEALDKLEGEVNRVQVPLSYADELYRLRTHIDLVRRKLTQPPPSV